MDKAEGYLNKRYLKYQKVHTLSLNPKEPKKRKDMFNWERKLEAAFYTYTDKIRVYGKSIMEYWEEL